MLRENIGFIGAGHMAGALIQGLCAEGIDKKNLFVYCTSAEKAQVAREKWGVAADCDLAAVVAKVAILVLAVRPQQMRAVLEQLARCEGAPIVVTLAAGLDLASYREILGNDVAIVRAMPNLAASVQASMTGLYRDEATSDAEAEPVEALFQCVGDTVWLEDEIQLDGMTALSGSGIAYFFRFMQAMAQVGEGYGFERDALYDILSLTALGAATLALDNPPEDPSFEALCAQIAVPGGTTAQALAQMGGLETMLQAAMDAVMQRSASLREEAARGD